MPKLGETQYYKVNKNGIDTYITNAWGGNEYADTSYQNIGKDLYIKGLQEKKALAQDFITKSQQPGYVAKAGAVYSQQDIDNYQKQLNEAMANQGVNASGYVAPGFEKFNPNGMPDEANYTEAEKAKQMSIPKSRGGLGPEDNAPPLQQANQSGGGVDTNQVLSGNTGTAPTTSTTPQNANPPASQNYTVKSGDSLSKIAQQYGMTWQELYALNKGVIGDNPNLIRPGMTFNTTKPQITPTGNSGASGSGSSTGSKPDVSQLQAQVDDLKSQQNALQQYGLKDSNLLKKDASGNYVPDNDAILKKAGLDGSSSIDDIIKKVSDKFGLPEIKADITKLDDQYADDIMEVNDNPWLSEAERSKQTKLIGDKYETKKNALYERAKTESDVMKTALTMWEQEKDREQQMLLQVMKDKSEETNKTTTDLTEYNFYSQQEKASGGTPMSFAEYQKQMANLKVTEPPQPTTLDKVGVINSYIDNNRGQDKKIAFETYVESYNKWQKNGGTLSDFKNRFPAQALMDEGNLNLLPEYLKPSDNNTYGFLNITAPVE